MWISCSRGFLDFGFGFSAGNPTVSRAVTLSLRGMFNTFFTLSSSNAPIQQVPKPSSTASRTICWKAIARSTSHHFHEGFTIPAMTIDAFPTKFWLLQAGTSSCLISGSSTITRDQSCLFFPEGASLAASNNFCSVSSGIFSFLTYFRMLLRSNMALKTSKKAPLL